ncbi:hypothetical protein [Chitinophaga flava]|uniref:Uncharacterized protein n=1 Tax=Chitinophaga flava TaxID=2259036 RepID=A0A365XQZ8_9BACT|nr:hypothetical protein [Chitinophaga flava]RBL88560.1 hypothetical protein DF182_18450 [Chitinophaga flava]
MGKTDEIRARYERIIKRGRQFGYGFAADNLQYFLNKSGEAIHVPLDKLRSFRAFEKAYKKNIGRFERSLIAVASSLKNGESNVLEEFWDVKVAPSYFSELFFASGASQITSTKKFKLEKRTARFFKIIRLTGMIGMLVLPYTYQARVMLKMMTVFTSKKREEQSPTVFGATGLPLLREASSLIGSCLIILISNGKLNPKNNKLIYEELIG